MHDRPSMSVALVAAALLGYPACWAGEDRASPAIAGSPVSREAPQSQATIARNAPTMAAVMAVAEDLSSEIGADKFVRTSSQLARFTETRAPECQEALRILGDTVDRVRVPVGPIVVDGDPSEWAGIMPPASFARLPLTGRSESLETWPGGVAAVVRQGKAGEPIDEKPAVLADLNWCVKGSEDYSPPNRDQQAVKKDRKRKAKVKARGVGQAP